MSDFDWAVAGRTLAGFGGKPITLYVPKTGLAFFDVLRLYGAIELYIGLRENVEIHDKGIEWEVNGQAREQRMVSKPEKAVKLLEPKKPPKQGWLLKLKDALQNRAAWPTEPQRQATHTPLKNPDSVFKNGVRDQAVCSYNGLKSGGGERSRVPLADALLAFAGQKRTENVAKIYFLPVFEGRIDLSKVISPLRVSLGTPNALCAQVLMLLALKTSLFAEGYEDRLSAVVYNTNFAPQQGFIYSGAIKIKSTAIGKIKSSQLVNDTYRIFRALIDEAWTRGPRRRWQSTPFTPDALAIAYWLMQPVPKHLSSMITSQERLRRGIERGERYIRPATLFDEKDQNYVKEVFNMCYGNWQGDHEAVRKFARAVASAIKWARGRDEHGKWLEDSEQRKNWYNEVVMLRSAPSAKAFTERAMILIEQGHREHGQIGTAHRQEDFDPKALLVSMGKDRTSFEAFRDLFRMYLIQESTYKGKFVLEADTAEVGAEEEPIAGGAE
jgi:hypothetical protein